jgi:methyl-accepting chemotaxis protein
MCIRDSCLNCEAGCNGGTGTPKDKSIDELEYWIEKRNLDYQAKYGLNRNPLSKFIGKQKLKRTISKHWKADLYSRTYTDLSKSNYAAAFRMPSHADLEAVYKDMLKETEKDHLNCQACGYQGCEQMASMIYNGINKKENCHVYLNNYLSNSVAEILEKMNRFSEGSLDVHLQVDNKGDIGKLYKGFNLAVNKIREMIITVTATVDETVQMGHNLNQHSTNLKDRMLEQDIQSNEMSAAVEEMTRTIVETSNNANCASKSADSAKDTARKGKEIVELTLDSMKNLSEIVGHAAETITKLGKNSERIGAIIEVIDEIADQTNLLALNAAIESARAGEHGRGFAVVADEVRKLAEKTSNATQEIASMIQTVQTDTKDAVEEIISGQKETERGINLSTESDKVLTDILKETETVGDMIRQVATSNEQLAATSSEIAQSIQTISDNIKSAAGYSEEISSVSGILKEVTDNLFEASHKFKLGESQSSIIKKKNIKEMHENI